VDLLNWYLDDVLDTAAIRANAADWRTVQVDGLVWVPNGPENYPGPGDVLVWGPFPRLGIGQYGHVAVNLVADSMHLVSFDQDWPLNSVCRLVLHEYGGVLGWHHLQVAPA
jgi:hypothetical protein